MIKLKKLISSKYNFITTEERSQTMSKIKSTNTKPEIKLRKALWILGYRYRKNYKQVPGKPDLAFTKQKIAIFIDGEFWHGYDWENKKKKISRNRNYWIPKIEKNIKRDNFVSVELKKLGWTVLRFWSKDINTNLDKCVSTIYKQLNQI